MKTLPSALIAGLALLAACADALSQEAPRVERVDPDPLLQPIAPDHARQWLGEEEPVRVHGNTYLVGFEGLTVGLIRTSEGLILIDGAVPQAVLALEANLEKLGLSIRDVKYILSTEPHYDHAGGLAALARDSGATVVSSPEAAEVLGRGRSGADDPQAAWLAPFPGVANIRALRDGETLVLGDVTVTARATPGHTRGSMSWSWRSCEDDDCRDVVFGSSLNPLAAPGYRYSAPANRALLDGFRQTFVKLRAMPCDILLSSHPSPSGQDERLAAFRRRSQPNPFIDPAACRAYADKHEQLFDRRLERERNGTADE